MKEIITSKGIKCLVDDEDFNFLNQWKWKYHHRAFVRNKRIRGSEKYEVFLLHRIIMSAPKGKDVDHIDNNPLNNQKSNLRVCTHQENVRNYSIPKHNTSGHKGVSRLKEKNKWQAYIKVDGEHLHLGVFNNIKDAAIAYNNAAKRFFGIFAKLNTVI